MVAKFLAGFDTRVGQVADDLHDLRDHPLAVAGVGIGADDVLAVGGREAIH